MARSKLNKLAIENYQKAPLASWILGITTGILIAAILALDLILPTLSIFTVPLLILPIIFSSTLQHALFHNDQPLTVRGAFKTFGLYFRSNFNGSFSFFKSLLFAVIVFVSFEMTISSITSMVLQHTNPDFIDSLNTFYVMLEDGTFTMEEFNNVLTMNHYILFNYLCIVIFPSWYLAIIFFIYKITRSAITIYFRIGVRNINNRFVNYVYRDVARRNFWRMIGNYLSLHWPLFILLLLGFAGGTVGGYFLRQELLFVLTCGVVGGALLAAFYLPFYFPNQEALFDYYETEFQKGVMNVTNKLLNTIQENIDLSMEEKEELEKKISELNSPLDDNSGEDNKKQ